MPHPKTLADLDDDSHDVAESRVLRSAYSCVGLRSTQSLRKLCKASPRPK